MAPSVTNLSTTAELNKLANLSRERGLHILKIKISSSDKETRAINSFASPKSRLTFRRLSRISVFSAICIVNETYSIFLERDIDRDTDLFSLFDRD